MIGNKDFMNEVLILQKDMHIARKKNARGNYVSFLTKTRSKDIWAGSKLRNNYLKKGMKK